MKSIPRARPVVGLAFLLMAGTACQPCSAADDIAAPISTAAPSAAQPPQTASEAPIKIGRDAASTVASNTAGPSASRRMHGEAEVSVGTGGYREASAVVTGPVGHGGEITIAVGQASGGRRAF